MQLLGDSIYTNPLMLGYAWQQGKVPLSLAALMRAIELNGVQVENNKAAFEWGRRAAAEPKEVKALVRTGQVIELVKRSTNLDDMIAKRVEFLTDYQNAAYAEQYKRFVDTVRAKEADLVFSRTATRPDASRPSTKLTEAVARYLFKLMAYKDEYEVARLHSDSRFLDKVAAQFEGKMGRDFQLAYHLAPPAIARRNDKGELQKQQFGPWMLSAFRMLAKLKGLRGTAFDPFGRTEERRTERALIVEYREAIEEVLRTLGPANLALAIEIARRAGDDPRLRPRQAAPPRGRPAEVGRADGRLARRAAAHRCPAGRDAHRADRGAGRAGHAAADASARFAHRALRPVDRPCPPGRLASRRTLG